MRHPSITPEERFARLIEELASHPGVTPPMEGTGFGAGSLKVHGKIFAMLVRGRLVLKLPASRVDALIAADEGERFTANRGRPMKEWIALAPTAHADWLSLASEALAFVAAHR